MFRVLSALFLALSLSLAGVAGASDVIHPSCPVQQGGGDGGGDCGDGGGGDGGDI